MKFDTIEDLQSLIDNEIEESTELEYKSSFAKENPKWKEELAKDVSAMANANGGTIIYGIRQKESINGRAVASELLPIPYIEMSKDKLSQLLSSNIQPIVDNIDISVISYDQISGFFIVNVPQSNTAHQNKLTHLYYKRRNATIEAMEDYEIRDVMNRSKYPVIELEFELYKTTINVTEKPLRLLDYKEWLADDKHYTKIEYKLKYRLVNKGKLYVKYINYFIHIPSVLNNGNEEPDNVDQIGEYFVVSGDNTVRDITGYNGYTGGLGPARYVPLLPGVMGKRKSFELNFDDVDDILSIPPIWYSVLADNAPERKMIVSWDKIKVIEKTENKTIDNNNIGFNIPPR